MILRLFYLMRCWTVLFVLSVCAASSCVRSEQADTVFLRDKLVGPLGEIIAYIVNANRAVGEAAGKQDFKKAHELFAVVTKRLDGYPAIIQCAIPKSILGEMHDLLKELEEHIQSLPDSQDKGQLIRECDQLAQCLSSLRNAKDPQQREINHYSPGG